MALTVMLSLRADALCSSPSMLLLPGALLTATESQQLSGSNEISHVALWITSEVQEICVDRSHIVKGLRSVTFLAFRGMLNHVS